ncbi:MAG: cysteine peptidase family C39 domain-containing protein [Candidatus ainarchaeum sp.]|nr:cysteine peptidase family C39 domain-containing protein [Candidatus ainarchaeum sp.]
MKKLSFPDIIQTFAYDCGANALESVLTYYGIKEIYEDQLLRCAKTNDHVGTKIDGVIRTLKKYKLEYVSKSMTINELKEYIDRKIPVMLLLQAWRKENGKYIEHQNYSKEYNKSHWVVAIGYTKNRILFEDPATIDTMYLPNKELMQRWHAREGRKHFLNHGIAVIGKPKFNPNKIEYMD